MKKFFNTAGPSVAGDHFMIDPLQRIDVQSIEDLIRAKRYFVLHAPRQTGKTTCLLALMHHLNAQNTYRALYVNIVPRDPALGRRRAGGSAWRRAGGPAGRHAAARGRQCCAGHARSGCVPSCFPPWRGARRRIESLWALTVISLDRPAFDPRQVLVFT